MKAGDIVRYKPEVLETWIRSYEPSQEDRDYFSGELKIIAALTDINNETIYVFHYPATIRGGAEWTTRDTHKFFLVREGEPQKCKWKGCGKTHSAKGLCEA